MSEKQEAFLELLRAGLWEKEARLSQFGRVDYEEVMRLAEEQSVAGLVTAGLGDGVTMFAIGKVTTDR